MMLYLFWTDESIVWNETQHDIYYIEMDSSQMWKPHISVTNAHASNKLRPDKDWIIQHVSCPPQHIPFDVLYI